MDYWSNGAAVVFTSLQRPYSNNPSIQNSNDPQLGIL